VDPFGFLDDLFGGSGGGGYSTTQGGAPLNHGFSAIQGWAVGQAFSNAGPIGQYLGLLYGSPGTGISNVAWEQQQTASSSGGVWGPIDLKDGEGLDFTGEEVRVFTPTQTLPRGERGDTGEGGTAGAVATGDTTTAPIVDNSEPSLPSSDRVLEHLDRDGSFLPSGATGEPIEEVTVFGAPPVRPRGHDSFEDFLSSYQSPAFSGPERPLVLPYQPPPRLPRPRQPAARKPSAVDPLAPTVQPPDPNPVDGGPYFDVQTPSTTVPTSNLVKVPWMSDVAPPEQFLPWGAWEKPESVSPPRLERSGDGRIETAPTVTPERTFWDRGGTGLAVGAATLAAGVGILMFWNPVGWAAIGTALAIAGGVAATTASAVELSASYGGATSADQDAQMNRAVSATLGFSSPGGALGSVIGMVASDDPQQGFEEGAFWGGTLEVGWGIAASLPGALRALPGISRAALPWAKSLLLEPFWFFMSAGGSGGNARLARVFAAQGRIASRVRTVEYLGTTPLLERDADWARFQVFATRTRQEGIFRITYTNGQQHIVRADSPLLRGRSILEAKEGDFGQLLDLGSSTSATREAHIFRQAKTNIQITTVTGGDVGYLVSTELGTSRLGAWFGREFPSEIASGQLWIRWVPWRK
jgi:hypothetical protein